MFIKVLFCMDLRLIAWLLMPFSSSPWILNSIVFIEFSNSYICLVENKLLLHWVFSAMPFITIEQWVSLWFWFGFLITKFKRFGGGIFHARKSDTLLLSQLGESNVWDKWWLISQKNMLRKDIVNVHAMDGVQPKINKGLDMIHKCKGWVI